ncbi:MAG: DNA repair protein RecO [Nitrospinota bacterium]
MSIHADEAVVLGTSPYSNTSLIATFLARSEGKIRVVARGARSPKSKIGVGFEPASRIHAEWSMRASGNLGTLRHCDTVGVFHRLWADLDAMNAAAAILKTMDRIFGAGEGDEEHFDWLIAALEALDAGADAGSVEAIFIAGMLRRLGISPGLMYCHSCSKKPGSERAALDIAAGELRCTRCALPAGQAVRLKAGSVKAFAEALGLAPGKIQSVRFHPTIQGEIVRAARALISFHMGISLPARQPQSS